MIADIENIRLRLKRALLRFYENKAESVNPGTGKKENMKAVVFYEASGTPMEKIMEVFPRHKALLDRFHDRGELPADGAFADPQKDGSMGIFKSREAAEEFLKQDPFVLEGLAGRASIREWDEIYPG